MLLDHHKIINSKITGNYALKEKCINDMIGQIVNRLGFIQAGIEGHWG
jgi:hypothetical protein